MTPADVPGDGSSPGRSRLATRGADLVLLTVRELRLLLGLLLILFVTSETWRYVGRLTVPRLVLFVLATVAAALLVVGLGLRRTIDRPVVRRATVRVCGEVLGFGAALFGTFVLVGVVSVDAGLVAEWSGNPDGVLLSLGLGDPPLAVTRPLLQVAAFLASLGALVFAVEVIADASTRHTLVRDLVEPVDGPAAGLAVRCVPTADLSPAELDRLRAFLADAYGGEFGDDDWSHALGGVHVLATVDGELAGHAAVVVRQLVVAGATLRTGFVEAVATAPALRRRGVGSAVLAEVERLVHGGFELGALASSADGAGLYAARGWLRWRGPTAALTPDGVVDTPDEDVFVLPTPATPAPLDTAGRLVCDWRRGDLW